jgi:tetratricopeptide (TPR) repeat protein
LSRSPLYPGRAVRGAVLTLGLLGLALPRASAESPAQPGFDAAPGASALAPEAGETPAALPARSLEETRFAVPARVRAEAAPAHVPLALERLERAWWQTPAMPLEARVERVRAAADAVGVTDVEPLARALLIDPSLGSRRERAAGAVRLAPGLPAAQIARAQAEWSGGAGIGSALPALQRALFALPRHVESRLWFEATLVTLGFAAVFAAGWLWIAARGLRAATHAGHDLSHGIDPNMPDFAKAAAVATLILLPAALGEGLLGVALSLFALGLWASDARQRRALAAAALLVVVALGPLASAAGRALGAFSADPTVFAALSSETGWLDPAEALRLERASAAGDPLATQALARHARRTGDLSRARALSAQLLSNSQAVTPSVLHDAAQVQLALGDVAGAVELYQRAIELRPSADLWFNLAQAHVRAIDMDSHGAALAAAQALDPQRASVLTRRLAESDETLVDLPLESAALRARLWAAAGPAPGAELRAWVAPGVLGAWPWLSALAFVGLATAATTLARRRTPSRPCTDCATRLCARCRSGEPSDGLCADCARRRLEARHGGPWELRGERSGAAALLATFARRAAPLLPGLSESEPRRPGWSLAALTALASAVLLWAGRDSILSDPAAVGGAGPLAVAALAGAMLLAAIALGAWAHRKETL